MEHANIVKWVLAFVALFILIATQLSWIPKFVNYLIPIILICVFLINRFERT